MTVAIPTAPAPVDQPVVVSTDAAFRLEAQLASAVRSWLTGEHLALSVVDEVDSGVGIADLVAGHHDTATAAWRPAVCDPLLLALIDHTQTPAAATELAAWAPFGWRSLRDRLVLPALEEGLLRMVLDLDGTPRFQATLTADDPFTHLTAVELKLQNWRRAIAQAGRYRLWAERTYVALPAARVNETVLKEAQRNRVGVLAVHGGPRNSWVVCELESIEAAPIQPHRRRATAERVLAGLRASAPRPAGSPML